MKNTKYVPITVREAMYVTSHCTKAEAFVLDLATDIISEKLKVYHEI